MFIGPETMGVLIVWLDSLPSITDGDVPVRVECGIWDGLLGHVLYP